MIGEHLCKATGRELLVAPDVERLAAMARERVSDPGTRSLCLLLSLGTPADPGPLARVLLAIREAWANGTVASWGVLTGTDDAALSRSAARAVLAGAIASHYSGYGIAILDGDDEEGRGQPFTPWRANGAEADGAHGCVQRVALSGMTRESLGEFRRQSWSAIVVRGHGRSYCACNGFLCGARRPEDDAEAPLSSCVLGFSCADASYLQNDPRTLDSAVGVFDTCGAANWASPVWQTGIPALAFLAVEGSFSSVIASDGITQSRGRDAGEVLHCLDSAGTLGEATALLNRVRAEQNVCMPYFLLGDPDAPCGSRRWPFLSETARASRVDGATWVAATSAGDRAYVRLDLPPTAADSMREESIFVWSEDGQERVVEALAFDGRESCEVRVGLRPADPRPLELRVQRSRTPSLPRGLAREALELPVRVGHLRAPWSSVVPRLIDASRRILRTQQYIDQIRGRAVVGRLDAVESVAVAAVAEWLGAHAACVSLAVQFRGQGLWPFFMWSSYDYDARNDERPCPVCGRTPTILRSYACAPGLRRAWWECVECDLIADEPMASRRPAIELRAPARIRTGETMQAEVAIDNGDGAVDLLGAGCLVVDRKGHGVSTSPELFPVRVDAGESRKVAVSLACARPDVPHAYRVRVLLFLNGEWTWRSRPLRVLPREGEE